MLTNIFYAIMMLFGFLTVIGILSLAALVDIFIGIFPYIMYAILLIELVVSITFVGIRIREGNGVVKSIFASVLCLFNSAQYLYYQGKETQIIVFIVTSVIMGGAWLACVVYPWITILRDGEGEGLGREVAATSILFVLIWWWEHR